MTLKQFKQWCNDRCCDGCWGFDDAKFCVELLDNMNQIPWWRRNKTWKKIENRVVFSVVSPTNKKYKRHLAQRWTEGMRMAKEICQDCECIFEPKSHKGMICPECHRKRLSQYAKERNLNKLGNDAYSVQQAMRRKERR